ncbi:MAG: glycosyltransferase family 2 protein [Bacteroidaceae bacterium]|nr:glycosyltransferase family 2 protein [Bacteroidaceae bacterium]
MISVIINTYNAERHLAQVLESVQSFDEIILCDMESTDSTVQIAANFGCSVITFPKGEHNIVEPARQFAIDHATHEWILVVDADELVTPQLREYLYQLITTPDAPDGLYIPRKNYFMGRFMHCHYPDYILRFFRKSKTTWPPIIHQQPHVKGRIEHIPASRKELAFGHLANDTISQRLIKTDLYTDNELLRKANKHYTHFALIYRPFHRFFKAYLFKGGFRDGTPGFIKAVLEAYYQFIMLAKMEEQKRHIKCFSG